MIIAANISILLVTRHIKMAAHMIATLKREDKGIMLEIFWLVLLLTAISFYKRLSQSSFKHILISFPPSALLSIDFDLHKISKQYFLCHLHQLELVSQYDWIQPKVWSFNIPLLLIYYYCLKKEIRKIK